MGRTKLTRRNVALYGLAFAAGGCFAGVELRAAWAAAVKQGKPLLTQKTVSAMLRGPDRVKLYTELASLPETGLLPYLRSKFALTRRQVAEIKTVPRRQVAQLKQAAAQGLAFEQRDEAAANEKRKKAKELQEELEEIQKETDSAWGKIKGFFGNDGSAERRLEVDSKFSNGRLIIAVNEIVIGPKASRPRPTAGQTGPIGQAQTKPSRPLTPGLLETGGGLQPGGPASAGSPIAPQPAAPAGRIN
jgi:hypothetical protein